MKQLFYDRTIYLKVIVILKNNVLDRYYIINNNLQGERKEKGKIYNLDLTNYPMSMGVFIEFLNHNVVFLDDFSENTKKIILLTINNFKLFIDNDYTQIIVS